MMGWGWGDRKWSYKAITWDPFTCRISLINLFLFFHTHSNEFFKNFFFCCLLIEIWLRFIRFELERGDPTRVGNLHHRAKMTLDRTLSDEFLVQYTLLQLQAWLRSQLLTQLSTKKKLTFSSLPPQTQISFPPSTPLWQVEIQKKSRLWLDYKISSRHCCVSV